MSGNRRKNTVPKPAITVEDAASPRLVAIPKSSDVAAKSKAERIGESLRQARIDRGDDLYLIAEYLCIKPVFLIALENSHYDELPADAYVIGFLRTYANFLGVDGKDAVDRYRYEMAGRRKKPVLSMPIPMSEGRAPSGLIIVGATLAVLLIYALWYGISSANRTEVNVPPPLPTAAQTTAPSAASNDTSVAAGLTAPVTPASPMTTAATIPPAAPGIVVTANAPPTSPTASNDSTDKNTKDPKNAIESKKQQVYGDPEKISRIIIRASQSSWIMITDDTGKAIFDHVLKPGDMYKVPNKPGLSLTTGNGNGIVISLDGTDLPKVATGAPHVVRNITLDPDRLTAGPSSTDQ